MWVWVCSVGWSWIVFGRVEWLFDFSITGPDEDCMLKPSPASEKTTKGSRFRAHRSRRVRSTLPVAAEEVHCGSLPMQQDQSIARA